MAIGRVVGIGDGRLPMSMIDDDRSSMMVCGLWFVVDAFMIISHDQIESNLKYLSFAQWTSHGADFVVLLFFFSASRRIVKAQSTNTTTGGRSSTLLPYRYRYSSLR